MLKNKPTKYLLVGLFFSIKTMSDLKERKLKAIDFQIQEIENNPGY